MASDLLAAIDSGISWLQTLIYVDVLQPVLYWARLMGYDEETYDALYWVLIGVLQIILTYVALRPLEALRPAEIWRDRKETRVDVIYTWITKLGVVNMAFFFLLQPVFDHLQSLMAIYDIPNIDLDTLWPGITDRPLISFAIYFVVLDFSGYWYHRWQHRFGLWWELHAVHHSQRRMSLWTDDRNHVLDTILQAAFFAGLSLFIGVEPSQYIVLVAVSNFFQALQHVNARLPFACGLDRLLVSPSFHRRHHAIGYGHEGTRYGCNFGVLLPWWDMLFGTASWNAMVEPTGIRDQLPLPDGKGRSYGDGFWGQQWLAIVRIAERLRTVPIELRLSK